MPNRIQPEQGNRRSGVRRPAVIAGGITIFVVVIAVWVVQARWNSGREAALEEPHVAESTSDGRRGRDDADSAGRPAGAADAGNGSAALDEDERFRRLAVGTWENDYQAKRTMTLCDDGTGTMVVELSGLSATLFASRLEFEMQWSVENGRIEMRTIGGKPADKVNLILKTMGDRVVDPILELTETRMLLLGQDGETKHDWRRVR